MVLFLGLAVVTSAQNIQDIDFKSIQVDNLSESQIQQIADEMESRGVSMSQMAQLAQAQGMPRSEVLKLQRRLSQSSSFSREDSRAGASRLRSDTANLSQDTKFGIASSNNIFPDEYPGISSGFNKYLSAYTTMQDSIWLKEQKLKNKIFGFELFSNEVSSFEPSLNIPTPKNYQLGPGDELIIDIWGAAQNTYWLEVSPDGMVIIDNLGPISIIGLTIDQTRQRLLDRLGTIYSGLNPQNENQKDTYMQVSLGQVRSIKVTVLGEVTKPGTYTLPSLATVFNALYSSGGPTAKGSFRKVDVIRGDSVYTTFDLYDLLVNGNQSDNIRLRDQDIIKINPYLNRVEIEGKVKRPGIYETYNDETLAHLLRFTGGFTGDAYTHRIKVIGSNSKEQKINSVAEKHFDSFKLKNGDQVTVGKTLNRFENLVEIQGAVFREGQYELTDSTTVYSLIQQAEGLRGDAFGNRGLIYREQDDYTLQTIPFDVSKLVESPERFNISLEKNDLVVISSIFDLREDYFVEIRGAVQKPSQFNYADGMTLKDLIFQAGGFREDATPRRVEVARRIVDTEDGINTSQIAEIFHFSINENLELNAEEATFELKPFDKVYIRTAPNYSRQHEITIVGEVNYPGTYTLESKNDRISDMIIRAGGLTNEAYLEGATLFRARKHIEQDAQRTEANVEGSEQTNLKKWDRTHAQVGINLPEVMNVPNSKFDLFVEEGDSLFIPKQLQTVTVRGGVFYPTTVRYDKGLSYKDYITQAGGFNDVAKENKAYVIYANGEVDRVKKFLFFKNFPNVKPGATIVVPQKESTRRLSPQERVSLLSAIVSTAALITTTIVQIAK